MSTSWTLKSSSRGTASACGRACFMGSAVVVSSLVLLFANAAFAAISPVQFSEVKVNGRPAVDGAGETWGAAWGDYDGDGDADLWLNMHAYTPTGLYINDGAGKFANAASIILMNGTDHYGDDTHGAAWADFDNDGDADLIEVSGAGTGKGATATVIQAEWRNNLWVNSVGALSELGQVYGVDYPRARSRTPLWMDYDGDGKLDLFNGALKTLPEHYPSAVYRQGPTGFVDVTALTGFTAGSCQSVMLSHLGPNREPAIVCVNSANVQAIFDVSAVPFRDLRSIVGNAIYTASLCDLAIGDFNGDLLPDVFGGVRPPSSSSAIRTGASNDRIHALLTPSPTESGISFAAPGDVELEFGYETVRADIRLGVGGIAPPSNSDSGIRGPNLYPHRIRLTLSAGNPNLAGIPAIRTSGIYIGLVAGRWEIRTKATKEVNLIARSVGISNPSAIGAVTLGQGSRSPPKLFLNQAGMLIQRSSAQAFPGVPIESLQTYAASLVTGDFDNDMDLDVYMASSGRIANVPNLMFENQGNGTFTVVEAAGGASGSPLGRSDTVTLVDFDQDGSLDLFVTQGQSPGPFAYESQQQLFRNRGIVGNWVLLDLEGVASNRDGVGAVVYATTPDGKIQMREQANGVHRYSQDFQQIHFGLGANDRVDVTVEWPSGAVDRFAGLPSNQIHHLVEGGEGGVEYVLTAENVAIDEAAGNASIGLAITPAPALGSTVNVNYESVNGSAQAGSDFGSTSGSLTFGAGQSFRSVSVTIVNDIAVEGTESFTLRFTGASTGSAVATITISDDDEPIVQPACGAPSYSKATESALFVWKDCESNYWHVRATAGGRKLTYRGSLTSNPGLTELAGFSMEAGDLLPLPDFKLVVSGSSQDGFDFRFPTGSNVCLRLTAPTGTSVVAGSNRLNMGNAIRLPDFGACGA